MFQVFCSGFKDLEKVTVTIEAQQEQKEDRDAGIEQLKSSMQALQRNSSLLVRDVETVMQKQLATAMHRLVEGKTTLQSTNNIVINIIIIHHHQR